MWYSIENECCKMMQFEIKKSEKRGSNPRVRSTVDLKATPLDHSGILATEENELSLNFDQYISVKHVYTFF